MTTEGLRGPLKEDCLAVFFLIKRQTLVVPRLRIEDRIGIICA